MKDREKGLDMASRDLKAEMVNLMNGSGLPATLLAYILNDLLCVVNTIVNNAVAEQEESYKKALEESRTKGEEKNGE